MHHSHIHTQTYAQTCTHTCTYHTHMHTRTHAHKHTHTHTQTRVRTMHTYQVHNHLITTHRLTSNLGSGQFGTVDRGVWRIHAECTDVAVKMMREGASENDRVKFLQEAAIMGQFSHRNVVKLHGVVTVGEPVSLHMCISHAYCNLFHSCYPGHDCRRVSFKRRLE